MPRLGTRIVGAKELSGVMMDGKPLQATSETRMDSVRDLFARGRQNQGRGVLVSVSPGGKQEIVDGRHRILVARETGAKVKVTFVRGTSAQDKGRK